jgi:hypothetical protein
LGPGRGTKWGWVWEYRVPGIVETYDTTKDPLVHGQRVGLRGRASEVLQAFHRLLGGSNMMAYVVSVTTMMYLRMTWLWLLA